MPKAKTKRKTKARKSRGGKRIGKGPLSYPSVGTMGRGGPHYLHPPPQTIVVEKRVREQPAIPYGFTWAQAFDRAANLGYLAYKTYQENQRRGQPVTQVPARLLTDPSESPMWQNTLERMWIARHYPDAENQREELFRRRERPGVRMENAEGLPPETPPRPPPDVEMQDAQTPPATPPEQIPVFYGSANEPQQVPAQFLTTETLRTQVQLRTLARNRDRLRRSESSPTLSSPNVQREYPTAARILPRGLRRQRAYSEDSLPRHRTRLGSSSSSSSTSTSGIFRLPRTPPGSSSSDDDGLQLPASYIRQDRNPYRPQNNFPY